MQSFNPIPQSGASGTLTGASDSFMLPQLQGYMADVTIIASGDATARTLTVTDNAGDQKATSTGVHQIILRYFVENLEKARYNKVTISAVPASWSFDYYIAFHRVTGDTRNGN